MRCSSLEIAINFERFAATNILLIFDLFGFFTNPIKFLKEILSDSVEKFRLFLFDLTEKIDSID